MVIRYKVDKFNDIRREVRTTGPRYNLVPNDRPFCNDSTVGLFIVSYNTYIIVLYFIVAHFVLKALARQ